MTSTALGKQILVDFFECDVDRISDVEKFKLTLVDAARMANATVVTKIFHEFNPHGLSGVIVIAESHIAVHSWPEYRCVSVDIFTCSDKMRPFLAIDHLESAFQAQRKEVKVIERGCLNQPKLLTAVRQPFDTLA